MKDTILSVPWKQRAVELAAASVIAIGGYSTQAHVIDDNNVVIEEPLVIDRGEDDGKEEVVRNRSAMERCAARFSTFDPDTGNYMTHDGNKVLCPYLKH